MANWPQIKHIMGNGVGGGGGGGEKRRGTRHVTPVPVVGTWRLTAFPR